jgi:MFS family permease
MKVVNPARILRSLLPAERNGRRYVIITMIDAIGNGLFVSGLMVFAIRVIRLDAQQITLGFSAAGLIGILVSGNSGKLVDYLTPKRTMLISNLMSGLACLGYCFIHSFALFLLLTCIDTALNMITLTAIAAYVGAIADGEDRVRLRAQARSLLNAGFGAGAGLAAAVLAIGTTSAYYLLPIGDAVSFFILVVLVVPLRATGRIGQDGDEEHRPAPTLPAKRNLPFLAATALNAILQLHEVLTLIIVPLWIVVRTSAPKVLICALIVGNTVGCVLFQVRAAKGTESLRTSVQKVQLAAVLLLPGCLAIALSGRTSPWLAIVLLVAACASFTGAELFQTAGATGILYALVPSDAIADYAGVLGMSRAAVAVVGPGIVGWLVLTYGSTGWIVLGVVTVAAAVLQRIAIAKAAALLERKASATAQPDLEPVDAGVSRG